MTGNRYASYIQGIASQERAQREDSQDKSAIKHWEEALKHFADSSDVSTFSAHVILGLC